MYEELIESAVSQQNLKGTVWKAKALPSSPGVYAILHRETGKIYIGSAMGSGGIRTRLARHRSDMRLKRHGNPHLQAYHDHYGMESFDVLVLEITSAEAARQREMQLLEKHKPWSHGFNVTQVVDEAWAVPEQLKETARKRQSKPFRLQLGGDVFEGDNLAAFCRDRDLHQGAMTQVNLGKKVQFKGWTQPGKSLPSTQVKNWTTGEVVAIPYFGGNAFARQRGLVMSLVSRVLSGAQRIHQGWTLAAYEPSPEEVTESLTHLCKAQRARVNGAKGTTKRYHVRRGSQEYEGSNLSAFCRAHGLSVVCFSKLCRGEAESHRGFTRVDGDVVV